MSCEIEARNSDFNDLPESVTDLPQSVTDLPQSVTDLLSQSQTCLSLSRTCLNLPQSVTDLPQSVTDLPQSVTDLPQSVTDLPQSVTDLPQSVTDLPQSVTDLPQSVTDLPQSVTDLLSRSQTSSVGHRPPQSVTDLLSRSQTSSVGHRPPQSVTDLPQSVTDLPQSVTDLPQSVTDLPQNQLLILSAGVRVYWVYWVQLCLCCRRPRSPQDLDQDRGASPGTGPRSREPDLGPGVLWTRGGRRRESRQGEVTRRGDEESRLSESPPSSPGSVSCPRTESESDGGPSEELETKLQVSDPGRRQQAIPIPTVRPTAPHGQTDGWWFSRGPLNPPAAQ
ncbi:unnamed protein product [Boreogadus saida]